MIDHPGNSKWSSYLSTSTGKDLPDFLSVKWILLEFRNQKRIYREGYIEIVADGNDALNLLWEKLIGQTAYGSMNK